jgi:putative sterol carrier protein
LIFRGMQRAFQPRKAAGIRGTVQYQLQSKRGSRWWLLRLDDGRLAIEQTRDPNASVTLRMPAATFARVAAGQQTAAAAALAGRLEIEGDLKLVARLGELFLP